MPFANLDDTRLFYRLDGRDGFPILVLSHSLGCDHKMWAPQMPDLLEHFQVLRYDTRGHGASGVPKGDTTMEQLGRDVEIENCVPLSEIPTLSLPKGRNPYRHPSLRWV